MNRFLALFLLLAVNFCHAQHNSNWLTKPFSDLGFAENLGRYEPVMQEEVLFHASYHQYKFFFTQNSFVIGQEKTLTPEERKERKEKHEHGEENDPLPWTYFKIEFSGANPNCTIVPKVLKTHTLNFSLPTNPGKTLKAKTYNHLVYENLYDGIDLVVELPEEGGLKYTFHVNPGADYKLIQMTYQNVDVRADEYGGLQLSGANHQFSDRAPESFVANNPIESHFVVEGNRVAFEVNDYDLTKMLIIDPWLETDLPIEFYSYDKAYEIGYDNAGNSMVLGNTGRHVALYDATGILQWVWEFLGVVFSTGDLTTNPLTGDTFFPNTLGGPTVKVDVTGTEVSSNLFDEGEPSEKWRAVYNEAEDELIIGCGGTGGDSVITRLSEDFIDEDDYEVLPAPLGEIRDVVFLDIDPDGSAIYFSIAGETYFPGDSPYDHLLYKVDYDNPNTVLWEAPTGYGFMEVSTVEYPPELTYKANGFNGIACGPNFLYTFDGRDLRRTDKSTGAFLSGYTVVEDAPYFQAGLDMDECGNLYVGTADSILVFNELLELIGGYELPGSCYDLVVGNGVLHTCGEGFVGQFDLWGGEETVNISAEPSICEACDGTVTIGVTGCSGDVITPESVIWEPGGLIGETITDLCPGWYVATVTWTNEEGIEEIAVDSVEVLQVEEELSADIELKNVTCEGTCNGEVTITTTSGLAPYLYALDLETNETGFFEDLCEGDYEITVTDANGCTFDTTVTIIAVDTPDPGIIIFNNPTCYGFADGSITVNIGDPMGGEIIEIRDTLGDLLNVGGSNTANALGAGWYYYYIDLGDGCSVLDSAKLIDPPAIEAVLNVMNPPCHGDATGVVVVDTVFNAQGDYGEIVYIWAPDPEYVSGQGADSVYGLPIGDYSLIINDDNGCSRVLEFTLTEPDPMVFVELGYEPAYCRLYDYQNGNGVVFAAVSGGVADYDYYWENLETEDNTTNSTWGGLNPGTYRVTATDENGCQLVEIVELDSLNPIADFIVVSDQLDGNYEGTEVVEATFINQSQYFADPKDPEADTTFFWNLDHPNANWLVSHDFFEEFDSTYIGEEIYEVCLVAQNKNGCKDTTCKDLIVHVKPEFEAPNIFTPGNGTNDLFTFEFRTLGIKEFHCEILNRWGVTVAEINDITHGWDGMNKNGGECPAGVYFYVYTAVATNKTVFKGQGTVQLVR